MSDTAQVLIFIRGVDKSYEVFEELLDNDSIHGTTTGEDIFKGVENAINKNLRWKKSITTDRGKNKVEDAVVALVSKAVKNNGGSKPLVLYSSFIIWGRLFMFITLKQYLLESYGLVSYRKPLRIF
uniref:General transcription factor II-I repeat domain-containing protein n=1 Tax=Anoplophora glabripennis TaxID=217634 RepID=V5IB27_ANOGL